MTVAVICGEKQGGLKFSMSSEETDVHAGDLIMKALQGIGSGGGHATMAGGYIPVQNRISDREEELYRIKERFISSLQVK